MNSRRSFLGTVIATLAGKDLVAARPEIKYSKVHEAERMLGLFKLPVTVLEKLKIVCGNEYEDFFILPIIEAIFISDNEIKLVTATINIKETFTVSKAKILDANNYFIQPIYGLKTYSLIPGDTYQITATLKFEVGKCL